MNYLFPIPIISTYISFKNLAECVDVGDTKEKVLGGQ